MVDGNSRRKKGLKRSRKKGKFFKGTPTYAFSAKRRRLSTGESSHQAGDVHEVESDDYVFEETSDEDNDEDNNEDNAEDNEEVSDFGRRITEISEV